MIPASILSAYALLKASIQANKPIASATPLQQAALVSAGLSLNSSIETARDALAPILDAPDPVAFAGDLPAQLAQIANATLDQAALDDLRGYVGRITFNLEQA